MRQTIDKYSHLMEFWKWGSEILGGIILNLNTLLGYRKLKKLHLINFHSKSFISITQKIDCVSVKCAWKFGLEIGYGFNG
jgi:hypothetical protein